MKEVSCVIQRHDDHDDTTEDIDGRNAMSVTGQWLSHKQKSGGKLQNYIASVFDPERRAGATLNLFYLRRSVLAGNFLVLCG